MSRSSESPAPVSPPPDVPTAAAPAPASERRAAVPATDLPQIPADFLPRMRAVALVAAQKAGLAQVAERLDAAPLRPDAWVDEEGALAPAEVLRILQQDPAVPEEQAGRLLALIVLYSTRAMQVPMGVPEGSRALLQRGLDGLGDPVARLVEMMPVVEERLHGPTPAPPTLPIRKPVTMEIPAARRSGEVSAAKAKERPGWERAAVALSGAVILGLCAYWGNYFYRQSHPGKVVDRAALSQGLPVKSAQVLNGNASIEFMSEEFAELPLPRQKEVLSQLLRRLEKVTYGQVQAGRHYYSFVRQGDDLLITLMGVKE